VRCFVALELDRPGARLLADLLAALPVAGGVRWCTSDQIHVTLKFLGSVAEERLADVIEAVRVASAATPAFHLSVRELGAFPSVSQPRVLWLGLEDAAKGCRRWLAEADPLLESLGFPPEQRSFRPHVTLGRSRTPAGSRVLSALLRKASPQAERLRGHTFAVRDVVLFESHLAPGGARHVPLLRAPLA
jgi:2'-5' RNA ligase